MTLGQKLRQLRQLEGDLRGLGRPLTQTELVRLVKTELGKSISQSYLSLIEKGDRKHLTHDTRQLLSKFFKVHPGYLISDPPGFSTELSPEVASIEPTLDRWMSEGAIRFSHDPSLSAALDHIATHADTRKCLLLLGEMVSMPGLVDRLAQTLLPQEAGS
ncbi:MAG TPA: helix-turn-helix transcriptional regulator [Vicinamibacterales bacterium]|jgi:transcriptional regulator with XRE-family HTH domain|nr:helix-turn-helix transcriptional regulator [Vicinamibacterales bacterium]